MADARTTYNSIRWGRQPDGVVQVHRPPTAPPELAELGRLVDIELEDGTRVVFPRDVSLAVATEGSRLYIVGRDPVMSTHTGRIHAISYQGAKGRDQKPYVWRHVFAENGGAKPRLSAYANGEARIERAGSRYTVKAEGITG